MRHHHQGNEKIEETVQKYGYFYMPDHAGEEMDANKIGLTL